MELVVGAGGGEVGLEPVVGGVPDDPQLLQPGRALAGHGPGPEHAPLIRQPPPQRERPHHLDVLVGDVEVPLTLPVAVRGISRGLPVPLPGGRLRGCSPAWAGAAVKTRISGT